MIKEICKFLLFFLNISLVFFSFHEHAFLDGCGVDYTDQVITKSVLKMSETALKMKTSLSLKKKKKKKKERKKKKV